MFRSILLLAFCSATIGTAFAQHPVSEVETPAQQLVGGTGEDSLNSFGNRASTVVSGYGEVHFQRDANAEQSSLNVARAILFVGHRFNSRIALFSELEVEDAKVEGGGDAGEVALEQLYLKFSLNPRQYIVAGLFLPRIGIINENHMPVNFNGVERPLVEQMVIPTTWREIGVGFYGQTTAIPFTYSVALLNGLNNAGFEHGSGFEGGRAEGQHASANSLALTAAVQYFAGNWKFQVSGYMGGTTTLNRKAADTLQLESGAFGTPLYLAEADIQYANKGFAFKALGCNVSIPKAESINTAYDNNTPEQMYGAYAELAYNIFHTAKADKWKKKQLNIFARYEVLNLNAKIPVNAVTDGTLSQSHIVAGLSFFPIPHVTIKADVRLQSTGDQNAALIINPNPNALPYKTTNSFINLGIGYSF